MRHLKQNKKIRNATRVSKHGVAFKSKLELYCYEQLKNAQLDFEYEPRKFVLLEPKEHSFSCFEPKGEKNKKVLALSTNKIRSMTYTPDFVGKNWVIETKGRPTDAFTLKWKLFKTLIDEKHPEIKVLIIASSQEMVREAINLLRRSYV